MSSLFCFQAPKTPKTCRNLFKNRLIVQPNRFERKKTFGKWQQSLEFFWKLSCLLPKVNWSRSRSVLHDFTFCRRGFDCLLVASAPSFVPSSPNNEILWSHSTIGTVQCQRSASGFVPAVMKFYAATLKCIIHRSNIQGENLPRARVFRKEQEKRFPFGKWSKIIHLNFGQSMHKMKE